MDTASLQFAGGGRIGAGHLGRSRARTRSCIEPRFGLLLVLTMSTLLLALFPVRLAAQSEATLGRWDRLYYTFSSGSQQVVLWRKLLDGFPDAAYRGQVDQRTSVYAPSNAWVQVHGIHAALVPRVGDADFPHGWVILWGYGLERGYLRERANQLSRLASGTVDPLYPQGYWAPRVALTPVLLWHPGNQDNPYGYTRYLFDFKSDRTGYEEWNPSGLEIGSWPIFNLFCSGHAFLPDGQLLIVGGHGGLWANEVPQQNESSVGYVGLRLAVKFNGLNFTRGNLEVLQPLWDWRGYEPPLGLHEPRWYPSVVALPDGKVLIVGGTRYGFWGGTTRYTEYHEIYDPCANQLVQSDLPVPSNSDLRGITRACCWCRTCVAHKWKAQWCRWLLGDRLTASATEIGPHAIPLILGMNGTQKLREKARASHEAVQRQCCCPARLLTHATSASRC